MNKFIDAIKELNFSSVKELLEKKPAWIDWSGENGKNALHFLGGVTVAGNRQKAEASIKIVKLLLKNGMDINSVHKIPEHGGFFPATPLWYAYTRGRNKELYRWLLKSGANPNHCMFAIAWYDDVEAAELFKKYGAPIDDGSIGSTPFLAAFNWRKFKVAEWFLKNGADVNAADPQGNTALFYAVKRKYPQENIELLLRYGADINKANKQGISPKQFAEMKRQRRILSLLNKLY